MQFIYNDNHVGIDDWRYHRLLPGIIADDLDKIYPAAVYKENNVIEGWVFDTLIPPMLKLIQEQHADIEALKARVSVLEQNS